MDVIPKHYYNRKIPTKTMLKRETHLHNNRFRKSTIMIELIGLEKDSFSLEIRFMRMKSI